LGDESLCHRIAISPDSKTLAVAVVKRELSGEDGHCVRLWNIATRKFIRAVHDFEKSDKEHFVAALAFSPQGDILALGTEDEITLCNPKNGATIGIFKAKMMQVNGLAFTSDNKRLISNGGDGKVREWQLTTGECRVLESGGIFTGYSLALSPDDKTVALMTNHRALRFWDLASGNETFGEIHDGHSSKLCALSFSPNGQTLASADWFGGLVLWDTASWRQKGKLRGARMLGFSPDGTRLATTRFHSTQEPIKETVIYKSEDGIWDQVEGKSF
jgi:WD40 repeat protein